MLARSLSRFDGGFDVKERGVVVRHEIDHGLVAARVAGIGGKGSHGLNGVCFDYFECFDLQGGAI